MSLNQHRRGYRDPHRHAQVVVTYGPPVPHVPRKRRTRTYRTVTP